MKQQRYSVRPKGFKFKNLKTLEHWPSLVPHWLSTAPGTPAAVVENRWEQVGT